MMFRQGDTLYIKVDKIPNGLVPKKDNIILEGEATGHFHRLQNGQLLVHRQTPRNDPLVIAYVDAKTQLQVTHNKHDPVELQPGLWRIQRQRQWPLRVVAD